jgi:hypothetical protein
MLHLLVTTIKRETKYKFHAAIKLLFYIPQKYIEPQQKLHMLHQHPLPHINSGLYITWQQCHSHIMAVMLVLLMAGK